MEKTMKKEKKEKVAYIKFFGVVSGFIFEKNQGSVEIVITENEIRSLLSEIRQLEMKRKKSRPQVLSAVDILSKTGGLDSVDIIAAVPSGAWRADLRPGIFDIDSTKREKKGEVAASKYEVIVTVP